MVKFPLVLFQGIISRVFHFFVPTIVVVEDTWIGATLIFVFPMNAILAHLYGWFCGKYLHVSQ